MITCTWRTKLALVAGATFLPASVILALAPAAGAAASNHGASPAASPSPGARAASPAAKASPGARASAASARPGAHTSAPVHGPGNGNPPASRNGDNGTVKIHNSTTSVTDPRNQPHVCKFYLDGFGFDAGQSVSWYIKSWPPTGDRARVAYGALTLDSNGNGYTKPPMGLPDGHYKLFWNFTGEKGLAKQKVFWVRCLASPSTPPPTTPPPPPPTTPPPTTPPSSQAASSAAAAGHSGLPITGWPLALIAGAGAVLLGTGGTAIAITLRRRGLHSSH